MTTQTNARPQASGDRMLPRALRRRFAGAGMAGLAGLLSLTLSGRPVGAQENAATPTSATPDAHALRLLDEIPNLAVTLTHQWQEGVPDDVIAAEQSTDHYGRLIDGESAQAVSMQDCIALAVRNNTDLQIQRLGPVAAASQVRKARSVFDPALFTDVTRDRLVTQKTSVLMGSPTDTSTFTQDLIVNAGVRKTLISGGQLSGTWSNKRMTANPSVANPLVPAYTSSLALSLNQPLLRDFGWRYALLLVDVAANTEQVTYHQYEAGIANLIAQVERTYWLLVLAIENVKVQEQGLTLARELQRQNEGKFAVGALPKTAVLEAKSEVARREANLIRFAHLRDVARDNLRAVINYRQPDAAGLLMIEPKDTPAVVPYDIDLNRSLQTALSRRPELLAARLEVHGKGLMRKVAENQLLPRLNFVGNIGVNGTSGGRPPVTFPGYPTGPQAPAGLEGGYDRALGFLPDGRFYNYSAGATIEIPIDNAAAKADYSKANIDLDQSHLSLRKLEETVTLEIKQAVSTLQADLKSVDATRIARELAEENVSNQQARYDVGLATTKDLLDFLDRQTQARAIEIEALTRYNSDLAEMHRVEGTLLQATNVILDRAPAEGPPWWARF